MHNQPEVPMHSPSDKEKLGKKKQTDSITPTPPNSQQINPGEDLNNVGNKLLKMMGWTEGSGLGSTGEGRVEPM